MMEVWWGRWWKKKADRFQGCWTDRICRTWWLISYVMDDVKRIYQRWLLGTWFRKQDEWGVLFFETGNRKEGTGSGKILSFYRFFFFFWQIASRYLWDFYMDSDIKEAVGYSELKLKRKSWTIDRDLQHMGGNWRKGWSHAGKLQAVWRTAGLGWNSEER